MQKNWYRAESTKTSICRLVGNAGVRLAVMAAMIMVMAVARQAAAEPALAGAVGLGTNSGQFMAVTHTYSTRYFITVPGDGVLMEVNGTTFATTAIALDGGSSVPWGIALYEDAVDPKVFVTEHEYGGRLFVYHFNTAILDAPISMSMGSGTSPYSNGIAVSTANATKKIYITDCNEHRIRRVNADTMEIMSSISGNDLESPIDVAVNETTNRVYVLTGYNKMFIYDGSDDSYIGQKSVFHSPKNIAINEDDNKIYITHNVNGQVTVIDGDSYEIEETLNSEQAPYDVAYHPDSNLFYVTVPDEDSIYVYNAVDNTPVATAPMEIGVDVYGIDYVTPGLGPGGSEPWRIGVVSPGAEALLLIDESDTYAPVFEGITSATDGASAATPTINLSWSAATDLSTPVNYLIFMSETSGDFNFSGPIHMTGSTSLALTAGMLAPGELEYGDYKYFVVRASDSAVVPNVDTNVEERGVLCSDGAAPTGGEVTDATDTGGGGEIQLSWGGASDNSDFVYNIYYSTTSGGQNFTEPDYSVASTTTTIALNYDLDPDFNFENGQEYFFVVRAEDAAGLENTNTTERSATPSDSTPPVFGGIINIVDTARGGQVKLFWANAEDNSPPITYNIYYNQGVAIDDYLNPDATTTIQTGVYYINGLTNDVQYTFAVRAEDSEGNEDSNTDEMQVTPTDSEMPTDFSGISDLEDAGTGSALNLEWSEANDNSIPISYNIYMRTSTTSYNFASWTYQTQNATYQVTGLTMGVEYSFVVRAEDAAGNEASNTTELSAIPTDGADPVFSGISSATPTQTAGELQLQWNAASDTSSPITYNIYEALESEEQDFLSPTYATTSTSVIITGLSNGEEYFYVVRAQDPGLREDDNEVEKSATPNDGAAPVFGGITSLTHTGAYGSLLASWSAAADDSSPVTYLVYTSLSASSQDYESDADYTTTATSVEISGLINGARYYVSVRARDVSGLTSTNTEELFATPTDLTPPVFGGLGGVEDTGKGGELRPFWAAGADMSGPITYEIFMATGAAPIEYSTPVIEIANLTEYTFEGLTNGVSHKFSVWARDACSPPNYATNTVMYSKTPTDATAPTFDGIERVRNVTTSSKEMKAEWDAAIDTSPPITYNVYYKKNGSVQSVLADGIKASTSGLYVIASGLENKQTYCFIVRAEDAEGNEDTNTDIRCASPVDNLPPDFDGLETAVDTTAGAEVLLSWSEPTDDSPPIRYYIYYQKGTTTNMLDNVKKSIFDSEVTSTSVVGLDNDAMYYFAVGAADTVDSGANETTAGVILTATPTDRTPPAFSGLQSVSNTAEGGVLRLSWEEAADRSTPVTYNIYQTTTPGIYNYSSPTYQAPSGSQYDVQGLSDGVTYYFIVTAVDSSIYANESSTTTTEMSGTPGDTEPPVFSGVSGVEIYSGNGELIIEWATATDQSLPIQYNIYQASLSGMQNFSSPTYTTASTSYIADDFLDGQWAFFVVRAQDSVNPPNEDTNSVEMSKRYQDLVAPQTPGSVDAVPKDDSLEDGDEYVLISWATPTQNTDGSTLEDLTGYEIFRSTNSGGQNPDPAYAINRNDGSLNAMIPATWTSYQDYNVSTGTEYFYVVVAGDDAIPINYSPQSQEVSATPVPTDDYIPRPPENLLAVAASGQVQVNLTWTTPQYNENWTPLTDLAGYKIYRGVTSGNYSLLENNISALDTDYQDTAVLDGTTYFYAMTSFDASDNESTFFSTETYATPGETTDYPPQAPSALQTTPGAGNCGLSWTRPDQNIDGSPYTDHQGYNIYRYDTASTTPVILNGTLVANSSYDDSTIETGVLYSYSVTAVDEGGNESASSSIATCIYGNLGVRGRIRVRSIDNRDPGTGKFLPVGKENMTIFLVNTSGQTVATAYTDSDGYYDIVYEGGSISETYDIRLQVTENSGYPVSAPMSGGVGYWILHEDINLQEGTPPFDQLPEPAPIGAGPLIGNYNCDETVNSRDLLTIKSTWLLSDGEEGYLALGDANGDGTVNSRDMLVIKDFWMKSTSPLPGGTESSLCDNETYVDD